jgi:F-type H+-transporting ATPase subunit delta
MNSLKIARTALRARPAALKGPLQRRGYADAVSDKVGIKNQLFADSADFYRLS